MLARRGLLLLLLAITGCQERLGPPRVPTVPVHGQVLVDGKPAKGVRVTFHALSQAPGTANTITAAPKDITDEQGRFAIASYVQDDGVPEGTYLITFQKLHFEALNQRWAGPDQFGGRYANAKLSKFPVTITDPGNGAAVELPPFKLSLNAEEKADDEEKDE